MDLFGNTALVEQRRPCRFDEFWQACPRKVSKRIAEKAYHNALRRGADEAVMIAKMKEYAAWLSDPSAEWRPDPKHPSTWLNGDCWKDVLQPGKMTKSFLGLAQEIVDGR
jgi:hypothetical protein